MSGRTVPKHLVVIYVSIDTLQQFVYVLYMHVDYTVHVLAMCRPAAPCIDADNMSYIMFSLCFKQNLHVGY